MVDRPHKYRFSLFRCFDHAPLTLLLLQRSDCDVAASSLCPGFMDTPLVSQDLQQMLATLNVPVAPATRVADAAMTALGTPVNGAQWVVWGDEPVRMYEWNPAVTL